MAVALMQHSTEMSTMDICLGHGQLVLMAVGLYRDNFTFFRHFGVRTQTHKHTHTHTHSGVSVLLVVILI